MKHLLNLLAAIALLVWGTHLVRTGILRVFGANLRHVLAHSIGNRCAARCSPGSGVTALVQSSTATALIVSVLRRPGPGHAAAGAGRDAGRRRRHQPDGGGVLVRPVVAVAAVHLRRRGAVHLAPVQRRSAASAAC